MKLAVDLVIRRGDDFLFVVRKYDPFKDQLALPGGFVEEDETVEDAARRELQEETGLFVSEPNMKMIGVFSKPDRDPRDRVVSVAYWASVPLSTVAIAADDAREVVWLPYDAAMKCDLAFDHRQILERA